MVPLPWESNAASCKPSMQLEQSGQASKCGGGGGLPDQSSPWILLIISSASDPPIPGYLEQLLVDFPFGGGVFFKGDASMCPNMEDAQRIRVELPCCVKGEGQPLGQDKGKGCRLRGWALGARPSGMVLLLAMA